jgi:hypothetical protein
LTKRLIPSALVVGLVATACVQIDRYPDTWGAVNSASTLGSCPSISGTYENTGAKPDGNKVSLARFLADNTGRTRQEKTQDRNQFLNELHRAQIVELAVVNDVALNIHVKGEGISVLWTISKDKDQFECNDGAFVIRSGGDIGGDNVAAVAARSMKLYPSRTHLMANLSEGVAGFLLFVPLAGYSDNWARFPREGCLAECVRSSHQPPNIGSFAIIKLYGKIDPDFALTANVQYVATRDELGCGTHLGPRANPSGGDWSPYYYWRDTSYSQNKGSSEYEFRVPIEDYDKGDSCRYRPLQIYVTIFDKRTEATTSKLLGTAEALPQDPIALAELEKRPRALDWRCSTFSSSSSSKMLRCEPAQVTGSGPSAESTRFVYEGQDLRFDVLRGSQ